MNQGGMLSQGKMINYHFFLGVFVIKCIIIELRWDKSYNFTSWSLPGIDKMHSVQSKFNLMPEWNLQGKQREPCSPGEHWVLSSFLQEGVIVNHSVVLYGGATQNSNFRAEGMRSEPWAVITKADLSPELWSRDLMGFTWYGMGADVSLQPNHHFLLLWLFC